jgi:hypothetical protein
MAKVKQRHKQEDIVKLIKKWESGTMAKVPFCKAHNIAPSVFHYWLKKLKGPLAVKNEVSSPFIPIEVNVRDIASAFAEIVYPNGIRLHLHVPVEVSFLESLVK